MNTPKIHILLSTYNGENYLKEQLDSIFQQSYQNFTLVIRDDGSSDQTPSLLAAYKEEHPELSEKIFLLPNPSEKIWDIWAASGFFWSSAKAPITMPSAIRTMSGCPIN